MKKRTIWIITVIMGVSFSVLLYLQVSYIDEIVDMRHEHFNESVLRCLDQVSHKQEQNETFAYLQHLMGEMSSVQKDSIQVGKNGDEVKRSHKYEVSDTDGTVFSSIELKTVMQPSALNKARTFGSPNKTVIADASQNLQQMVKNAYVYQRAILDEVVYNILYSASDKPLEQRINFNQLDRDLKMELQNCGINIPYHFSITTYDGREIYRCPEFDEKGLEYSFSQVLFRNDPPRKLAILKVHFPDLQNYIFSSVRFVIPSLIFTIVLIITFIFTVYVIFRQKKLTAIKNDFINNMTHEFKTPISTISLAAQMLNDPAVAKSPQMFKHISTVIIDETKRLRFQVEKVLQLSLFDRKAGTMKKKDVNVNKLIAGVVNTFRLKVEQYGGTLEAQLDADDAEVFADEMHLTNVIFNLMDNAVKYRDESRTLQLKVTTWNEKERLCVSIRDNGIGIRKDDLKKVFERFYRVSTGNRHDVKGFGLGLAYVKKIVEMHKGTIVAESDLGEGTNFIITLPIIKS